MNHNARYALLIILLSSLWIIGNTGIEGIIICFIRIREYARYQE